MTQTPRNKALALVGPKWLNGTTLRYCALGPARGYRKLTSAERNVFQGAIRQWATIAPGLRFAPTTSAQRAEIRIGSRLGGSTSCRLGRDALEDPDYNRATLLFGLPLTSADGPGLAVHELGHACGFRHEHQTPDAGLSWDMKALRQQFPTWNAPRIKRSVTDRNPCGRIVGPPLDPHSVMGYPLPPDMALTPPEAKTQGFAPGTTPSAIDKQEFRAWYPGLDPAAGLPPLPLGQSAQIHTQIGAQRDWDLPVASSGAFEVRVTDGVDALVGVRYLDQGRLQDFSAVRPRILGSPQDAIRIRLNAGYRFVLSVRTIYIAPGANAQVGWSPLTP